MSYVKCKVRSDMPCSIKVLVENFTLHHSDVECGKMHDLLPAYLADHSNTFEVALYPTRVLMQDFTGVPAIVDFVAMRNIASQYGLDPSKIEPKIPIDLVVDHSVTVNNYLGKDSLQLNMSYEMTHNLERFQLLKWSDLAFNSIKVVPPGRGICHQVNIEYLTDIVTTVKEHKVAEFVIGTDSHTTMVNGLGVLGWGVGGIEAEACALGQPLMMNMPKVVGVQLKGKLNPGITATDLVLTIAEHLKQYNVVSCFVEFYGESLASIDIPTRATIANMSPEFGSTCVYFPIDQKTLDYLSDTGRSDEHIEVVKSYAVSQGVWGHAARNYHDTLCVNLSTIVPSISGPNKPHDRFPVNQINQKMLALLSQRPMKNPVDSLTDGDIVLAAITSCTNTSNPSVLICAGLLAKNAVENGLKIKPHVKTSFAPGSRAVTLYLEELGLLKYFEALGFHIVGYGCTTCIGNSGKLDSSISQQIMSKSLKVSGVLSGNRNFSGRIHPEVIHNWLMSPPLVIAFALAGRMVDINTLDFENHANKKISLTDLWPSDDEIKEYMSRISPTVFSRSYQDVYDGLPAWNDMQIGDSEKVYQWDKSSTYIKMPPYLDSQPENLQLSNIRSARTLAILGDFVTTDHISPAGVIPLESPAGKYLIGKGVKPSEFNSYGARRGNFEVMTRGTFANVRIQNEMVDTVGGFTVHCDSPKINAFIYDVAQKYAESNTPLIVFAGKDYGSGSSRDWAAKGTYLLGVKVVIAESFERIHRSNLIGMGVLPCQFSPGEGRRELSLIGDEMIDVIGIDELVGPNQQLKLIINRSNGDIAYTHITVRIDSHAELLYFKSGGILPYVMQKMAKESNG